MSHRLGGMSFLVAKRSPVFSCTVVLSKKVVSLATARNRLRRQVREALRRIATATHQPFRCVVSIRTPAIPEGPALEATLVELLRESGILIQ